MIATSPIENLLSRLEDVRDLGKNKWRALCPAHPDRNPSLDISVADDGTVLLCCRSHRCKAAEIVQAIGLTMKDLFPPSQTNGHHAPKPRIVATYDYRDEQGELLYQVVRLEPKTFRQRRPDGSGWIWRLDDTRRVLYRLPELLGADPAEPVFVVEGEKDCDNLRQLGFVATCNVGGAGKWKAEYAEHLRGRHVAVIPDADAPGQRHGLDVARGLHDDAATVKVVTLDAGAKDATETIERQREDGRSDSEIAQYFHDLTRRAKIFDPAEAPAESISSPAEPTHEAAPRYRYRSLSSAEFHAADFRAEWIIKRCFVRNQPGVLGGPKKAMKTGALIDMAVSIASGTPFLNRFDVYKPRRVAIISGESGEFTIQETARRICRARGLSLNDLDIRWSFELPQLTSAVELAELTRGLRDDGAEVGIIDPLYLASARRKKGVFKFATGSMAFNGLYLSVVFATVVV